VQQSDRQFSRQDEAIAVADGKMTAAAMRVIRIDARRSLFIGSPP
jgi:hypothetical protein